MAITPQKLIDYKRTGQRITALTASDYLFAQILDQAGIDIVLVGDSLAMVSLGYDTTLPVTLDEMLHHARAVRRGVRNALMIVDLPFLSYQTSVQQAMESAGRALKEAEAGAVKLEGGHPAMIQTVKHLVTSGVVAGADRMVSTPQGDISPGDSPSRPAFWLLFFRALPDLSPATRPGSQQPWHRRTDRSPSRWCRRLG